MGQAHRKRQRNAEKTTETRHSWEGSTTQCRRVWKLDHLGAVQKRSGNPAGVVGRRDKEHVRKQREVFKKFDGINVGDPILRAYHEAMAEQKRKKMEKEIEEKHKNADGKVEK